MGYIWILHIVALAVLTVMSILVMASFMRITAGLKRLKTEGSRMFTARITERISLLRRKRQEYLDLPPDSPLPDISLGEMESIERNVIEEDITAEETQEYEYTSKLTVRMILIATGTMLLAVFLGGKEAVPGAVGIGGVVIGISFSYGVAFDRLWKKMQTAKKQLLDK